MSRRRWVQIDGELVEVTADYIQPMPETRFHILGDKMYHNINSPIDGADLSTRTKHREYMKAKNLVLHDDFKEHFAKAARERSEFYTQGTDSSRVQDVLRAVETQTRKG